MRNILQLYFLPARITSARRTTMFIFCEPAVCLVSVSWLPRRRRSLSPTRAGSHVDLWKQKLFYLLFIVNLCRFKIICEPILTLKKPPSMASIYLPPIARKKKVDGFPRQVLTLKYLIYVWLRKTNKNICGQIDSYSFPVKVCSSQIYRLPQDRTENALKTVQQINQNKCVFTCRLRKNIVKLTSGFRIVVVC